MKRKLVLTSAVVLILALLAAGTFAYFSKDARATNVITTGTISIKLNDSIAGGTEVKDGDEVTGYSISGVMPGQPVDKAVSITNNGTSPAWLRVKLEVSVKGADGQELGATFDSDKQVLTFDLGKGWFYHDGYYYYSASVAEKNSTAEFFAVEEEDGTRHPTLMLNPQLPNAYQGCTVTVAVQAQAVQVKNNNIYVDAADAEVTDGNGLPLTFATLSAADGDGTHKSSLDSVFGWPTD